MESLPRYPLSVILSFLKETEGTSFLITNKRFARQLLPVFELRQDDFDSLSIRTGKRRHRFIALPVQDPLTLLARLNTRRLYRRKESLPKGLTTLAIANQEWGSCKYPPELELLRFLDGTIMIDDDLRRCRGTLLVSYPRSGNTLVRSLLERSTGVVTGSDTRPDRNLSRELAEQYNLVGEGVTQASLVAFIKSHWPERIGNKAYSATRAILLVRNPYDAIDSYWNMNATLSHTRTLKDEAYEQFRDKFERLVLNEIEIWMNFLQYWIEFSGVNLLIVRFEDLVSNTEVELDRLLSFSLEQLPLSPFWRDRIRHVTAKPTEKLGSYQPREASKGIASVGKSLRKQRFSKETLAQIHRISRRRSVNYLEKFGYDIECQDFPSNFVNGHQPQLEGPRQGSKMVEVNQGVIIRPFQCEFGRALQSWRHSVTDSDRMPLPTVDR
jgi:Sulfotransferase domain